jgi:hypothetical protein
MLFNEPYYPFFVADFLLGQVGSQSRTKLQRGLLLGVLILADP